MGTLDGANVEIHEAVGDDNMFLFGLTTPEVDCLKKTGYNPQVYYKNNQALKRAVDELVSRGMSGVKYDNIVTSLMGNDPYMVMADFADYAAIQEKASQVYGDKARWNRMSLINIANAGRFAADRSIQDYAQTIWGATPVDFKSSK